MESSVDDSRVASVDDSRMGSFGGKNVDEVDESAKVCIFYLFKYENAKQYVCFRCCLFIFFIVFLKFVFVLVVYYIPVLLGRKK